MKNKILCPNCGSSRTLRLNGPFRVSAWEFQQRHECEKCHTRFLTWWEGEFLRTYSARNGVDPAVAHG